MVRTKQWAMVGAGVAVCLVLAGTAQAQFQGRGGGFGGMGGRQAATGLIRNEAVQKELGLSDEAKSKLTKLVEELQEETQAEMQKITGGGGFQALQNLSDAERQEMQTKLAAASQKLQEKYKPQIDAALTAEQKTRLKQIGYQLAGATALSDPEVAKELNVSDDQKKAISAAIQDATAKQRELFQGAGQGGGDIQERFAKMQELNQARDKQLLSTLSDEQKAEFEKLKGKPFDVSQLRGGFGGPGGKPGGPGRPGGKPGRPGRPNAEGKPSDAPAK